MKCTIPEICWHAREPVLSVDFQIGCHKNPTTGQDFWRVATSGADSHVVIWHLTLDEEKVASVTCVADLDKHQKAVNVVRFSPTGKILASADDESVIILWKAREESDIPIFPGEENDNKEQWTYLKVLRGHVEDVLDLSWSLNSEFLASASVDNSVVVWNVAKGGKKVATLSDYKGFVQGVSFDPLGKYVVSLCADRNLRLIYVQNHSKVKTVQRVSKARIPAPAGHHTDGKQVRLFHDDTFKSYFRRLTFTPDGNLIIAPSGVIEASESGDQKICNSTIVFSRHSLREPIAILPSFDESTIAVRCCPRFFKLREDGPQPTVDLPYRMIFAVATQHSVMIYDTQQLSPIGVVSNIHYTRLTDATWSSDGRILMVSSTDGYSTIIHFDEGELGEIYDKMPSPVIAEAEQQQPHEEKPSSPPRSIDLNSSNAVDLDLSKTSKILIPEVTDQKEAQKSEGKMEIEELPTMSEETEDFSLVLEDTTMGTVPPAPIIAPTTPKTIKTPRRVQLITLSSPKRTKND